MDRVNTSLTLSKLSRTDVQRLQEEAMEMESRIWDPPVAVSDVLK